MQKNRLEPTDVELRAANGTLINVLGCTTVPVTAGTFDSFINGIVTDHVTEVMLGADWLCDNNVQWDFVSSSIKLGGKLYKLHTRPRGERWIRRFVMQETSTVQPWTQQDVKCRVVFHGRATGLETDQWETEPAALQSGLLVARTLTPSDTFSDVPVRVMNLNEEPKQVKEGAVISDLEPVTVLYPISSGTGRAPGSTHRTPDHVRNPGYSPLPDYIDKLVEGVDPSTPPGIIDRLRHLMLRYREIFSESDQSIGLTDVLANRIDTGSARPIRQLLRRFPPAHVEAISSEVDKLLAQGVIEPASSPWASNVVLVRKKDGSYRCCIDYRQLNSVTVKDAYPVPRMDSCLDAMSGAGWFITIDMPSAYHQVFVAPEDMDKTAFICPRGMYR